MKLISFDESLMSIDQGDGDFVWCPSHKAHKFVCNKQKQFNHSSIICGCMSSKDQGLTVIKANAPSFNESSITFLSLFTGNVLREDQLFLSSLNGLKTTKIFLQKVVKNS